METPLDWLLGTKSPLGGGASGEPAWYDYNRDPIINQNGKNNYWGGNSGEPPWYDYDRSLLINNDGKSAPNNGDVASLIRAALMERR